MFGFNGVCDIIKRMMSEKIDFIFIDNGYTTGRQRIHSDQPKHETTYSVTVNNTRLNYITKTSRCEPFLPYAKRKIGGELIVICPPSQFVAKAHGIDIGEWVHNARRNLRHLDKPFIIREKQDVQTHGLFSKLLKDAALVVTSQSLTGLESIVAGVPVVSDRFSLSAPVSNTIDTVYRNLEDLQFPGQKKFGKWLNSLRDNEVTIPKRKLTQLDYNAFGRVTKQQQRAFHNYESSDIQSQFAR